MESVFLTPKDAQSVIDSIEALCNLVYLLNEEADKPEKVRFYANLSDQQLQTLRCLLSETNRMK
jgi:hypothetical protein